MKDIGTWLRAGDPLGGDPGIRADDGRAMRRLVVSGVGEGGLAPTKRRRREVGWPRPVLVAATVAGTIAIGILAGRLMPARDAAAPGRSTPERTERRQLQFATPGGTRVIWVFDPDFNL